MHRSFNMVHSHFTLCLRTRPYTKMGSPTPMVRPLDDSQRPSPFHGHGSWLVCEVALRIILGFFLIKVVICSCFCRLRPCNSLTVINFEAEAELGVAVLCAETGSAGGATDFIPCRHPLRVRELKVLFTTLPLWLDELHKPRWMLSPRAFPLRV